MTFSLNYKSPKLNKVSVIGSGFSGLSAACFLAKAGREVTVFEKNETIGGRARVYSEQGFKFDMGPSWYWMPDIFENFFANFKEHPSDHYKLVQLDPGFQIIFSKDDTLAIPAKLDDIYAVFEDIETGSAAKLKQFLSEGAFKYKIGMQELVYKPSYSWLEFATMPVIKGASKMSLLQSVSSYVRKYFKDERLISLMEFPVLFLGAMANNIPALYSLMNYAALSLGTWYPMGGMAEIGNAMERTARSLGVAFETENEIQKIHTLNSKAFKLEAKKGVYGTNGIVATGDYHHIETCLLDEADRNYDEAYWEKKTFAPSCLIFYIGVNKKIKKLIHHNLFFDTSSDTHAREIYETPQWPSNPLFYACCPSKTDNTVAPEGMENLFILIPIAPGLPDNEAIRESYFAGIIKRMEDYCGDKFMDNIVYKKSYSINDFKSDYHAYKGNAYGLANTLRQTAVLKPKLKNKKIKNLFYAGQLTVPGPGVPPALISGQIAAEQLLKFFK